MPDDLAGATQLSLRAVIDALPRAITVTDAQGRIVLWNDRAEALFGWAEADVLGRTSVDVLAAAEPNGDAAELFLRVLSSDQYLGARTVLHRDGHPVTVAAYTVPILDDGGQVEWVVVASEAFAESGRLERAASELTDRLRLALEAAQLGTWRWDLSTGEVSWDARMEELFGLPPGGFDGTFESFVDALHPEDRADVVAAIDEALARRGSYRVEHRVLLANGVVRWLHGAGSITVDSVGEPTGAIGCSLDVTEQAEHRLAVESAAAAAAALAEEERLNRERFEFLGAVNDALSDASSVQEVVDRFVRVVVPRLGDWCSVYLLHGERDSDPEVVTYHVDPDLVSWVESLTERYPYDPDAPTGMAAVIRTGQPEFYPEITPQVIDDALARSTYDDAATEELRGVLDRLQLRSSIAVPLVKGGRVLGGISFVTTTAGRHYTESDFDLARAVAGRVAASVENRRLADHQRAIAHTLQASLLPAALPDIPGGDLAVRYWASGEGIEVGGDFYDVIDQGDGTWVIAIGDVCGKGPSAAALTGLARHTIRQAVWRGDDGPATFQWLNRALCASGTDSFLTAALAYIRPTNGGIDVGVSLAGHPAPVLVRSNGASGTVGRFGDLLGVFPQVSAATVSARLEPGDVLVIFTDGISDVPPPHQLDEVQTEELFVSAAVSARSAAEVADGIEAGLATHLPMAERADDVAVAVLRASHT